MEENLQTSQGQHLLHSEPELNLDRSIYAQRVKGHNFEDTLNCRIGGCSFITIGSPKSLKEESKGRVLLNSPYIVIKHIQGYLFHPLHCFSEDLLGVYYALLTACHCFKPVLEYICSTYPMNKWNGIGRNYGASS